LLNLIGKWDFIITLSKVLNITGTSLVFIGLLFAFAAFALLNLGIFPALNRFLLMRRASMTAHTAAAKGQEIGGAIAALDSIAKELKKSIKLEQVKFLNCVARLVKKTIF